MFTITFGKPRDFWKYILIVNLREENIASSRKIPSIKNLFIKKILKYFTMSGHIWPGRKKEVEIEPEIER